MKKYIASAIALVMLFTFMFAGASFAEESKISVVTTIFPIYDWVREIVGDNDNVDITMLLDNGVDLHSYQPTAQDIMKVATCDVFAYVGGESDEWVEDALAEAVNPDMVVVNLVEAMGDDIKLEEIVEGMEHEHEHEHDEDEDDEEHDEEHDEDHDHEHEEIELEDIQDRELSDFAGEWNSLYPMLMAGELDAYLEHEAEEEGSTKEEALEECAAKWACDAVSVKIEGDTIAFTDAEGNTVSAVYTYAGFTPITAEDGDITGARYQFETDSADAPKYVQFNDHGHEPAAAEHFHLYFGNESFEALMDSETNSFFAPADMSNASVLSMLMSHDHDHDHEHEHEEEEDEHVWLSLRNAQKLVKALAVALGEADPANAETYAANADAYAGKLAALDAEYAAVREAADYDTVLFGDRFPFRYMVDDYDLNYFAAFSGCSAESEASFETIVFLAGKVDELGLSTVLTIEGDNHRIAETIVGNTQAKDAKVLAMDSLQSTTAEDVAGGITYLGVMKANLEVLKQALAK